MKFMPVYQRKTPVNAIQFFEDEYQKNSLLYPEVWDKAMFSEMWCGKTAKDGRYYIQNQPNTFTGAAEIVTVNNGDYIIRESMGVVYTMPKEVFEQNFEKVAE
jgi:hypothetical protein